MDNSTNQALPEQNWSTLNLDGREITILGTAHVLSDSKREVEELIEKINPDTVAVELCDSRYNSLKDKDRWKNLNINKVIKDGKGFLLLTNMILSSFQKRVGVDLESAPGDEMISAFKLAEERGKQVVLADRDINTTLKRAWGLSGFFAKMSILELLLESLFVKENVTKSDVQEMMEGKDVMTEMMNAFSQKLPKVKQVLIDERDLFLAEKIRTAPGHKILAVVGKGHMKGIIRIIENNSEYDKTIETLPKPGKLSKILPWILTVLVLGFFALGFWKGGFEKGIEMMLVWALVTGTTTGVAALAVLAHPLTILASWIVAPITTINPFLGAGMILGPLEAMLKKPQVKDLETLSADMETWKGFFKNRVTRILIVFAATSIGASIGTTVALPWVMSILGK